MTEIDINEIRINSESFEDYNSAIEYIRALPMQFHEKSNLFKKYEKIFKNLKNDENTILKEPLRAVLSSREKIENSLSFIFNKLSNSIQKNLGHETASYFYYSDWLLTWTIISYFPTIFCFVCIPHIIYWVKNYSIVNSMPNDDQIVKNSYCLKSLADFDNFNLTSLVQKSEFLNIVVYGCFPGDSNSDFGYKLSYSLQNAYLLSLIVFFLIWTFIIGSAVVKSISNSYIREIRIQNLNIFSSAIFCSWPFYSNDSKFIKKKRTQIINNLKMLKIGDEKKLRIKRVIAINMLFLVVLAGFLTGMSYLILINYFNNIDEFVSQRRVVLAAFLTIFNYLTPFICRFLSRIEKCPKSFETKLNLIRMYLMQHGLLGLIIAYIIINRGECWEDEIAKQLYTFLVFDFALSFFLDIILMMLYRFILKLVFPSKDIYFNSSYYSVNVLISQFLFWMGLYFTPYLGFIFCISSIVIFVVRVFFVRYFYKPPNRSENLYQNETNILTMTLVSFFLAFVLTGVFIFQFKSSKICGPFNNEKYEKPYDYLTEFKNYLFSIDIIGFVFRLLLSPGFFAFVLFFSSVLAYTMLKIFNGYKKSIRLLKYEYIFKKTQIEGLKKLSLSSENRSSIIIQLNNTELNSKLSADE